VVLDEVGLVMHEVLFHLMAWLLLTCSTSDTFQFNYFMIVTRDNLGPRLERGGASFSESPVALTQGETQESVCLPTLESSVCFADEAVLRLRQRASQGDVHHGGALGKPQRPKRPGHQGSDKMVRLF